MATAIAGTSNETQKKELAELKRIKIEQRFARQFYAQFKSLRFGIEACCYEDLESATLNKELCDWQNSSSSKIVVATETPGVFVEPIATVNIIASKSCPTIPSNVCTIVDLANIIAKAGTYSECFEIAADSWVITHNLGRYPSDPSSCIPAVPFVEPTPNNSYVVSPSVPVSISTHPPL